ncbi:electron transport complex subunit RsxG [Pelomicrobium sp. G1]|uniref:electron transport complex subunit RsxG n=1 Tax=unclassified Pelomicrobium TaxID=2815318 RepID=UPI003F760846
MSLGPGRSALRGALVLAAFALAGTLLLGLAFQQTREPIARAEEAAKLKLLNQVIPPELHDNDLLADAIELPANALLGTDEPRPAYRALKDGRVTAVAFEAIAPDGYNGRIRLLLAVSPEGRVLGVRVVAHAETPGLGDYIDIAKSDWIRQFDGREFSPASANAWRVKKDGGTFDAMAGATVTPRAVVKAVRKALEYFHAHRDPLVGESLQTGKAAP